MHKIVGLAICLSVLGGLIYIILAKGRIPKQGTVILNEDNISELELDFGQELSQYVSKEDNTLFVKDITGSDLNNAYVNNELIMERCYEYSSMIPLQEKEKLTFGYSYRIPTILLRADSNILFCNENGEHWETKEKCLKITFFSI